MKKMITRGLAAVLALFLVLVPAGCGRKSSAVRPEGSEIANSYSKSGAYDAGLSVTPAAERVLNEADYAKADFTSEVPAEKAGESTPALSDGRKLIRTYRFSVETQEFEKSTELITGMVSSCGGYVENSSISGNSYKSGNSARTASYVIRIPVANLDAFLQDVGSIGNVVSRSENVQDITLDYTDTASRIKSLETQRDSLMEMMKNAKDLSEMLTVQDHLTEVLYQLERYGSRLRTMDNQVDYSTLNVDLREVKIYTAPEPEPETFFDRLKAEFKDSLKGVGEFFEDTAIFFFGNLPGILVFLAIVFVIVLIIRRAVKKHRNKKAARKAAKLAEGPKTGQDSF